MPTLSIIIPNYNYGRFADRFFGSISAQSMSLEDVEIIFVDDGSTDDSILQAQKWSAKITCNRFEILTPPRSGRPGLVRNHGLALAKGKYLISIDPDDTLHPDFLATCIDTLEENPEIDLVYTDYQENSSNGSREIKLPDFNQAHLRTQNTLHAAALYRRKLWDAGARYRDNTDYEDWDYWVQFLMAGAKFLHIPISLYNYEFHDTNFSQQATENDGKAKAQIVLNNLSFFHPMVQQWAQGFMRNDLLSPAFPRGYIPTPGDLKKLFKKVEQDVLKR